jgi:hypothetical protein
VHVAKLAQGKKYKTNVTILERRKITEETPEAERPQSS